MRSFSAISIGSRVQPHRVAGTIHSVFADACNMECADGEIFTLLTARTPDQPGGIRLASPPHFSFRGHLSAGDRVSSHPGFLEVPDRAFIVDLRQAETWRRQLPVARDGSAASNWNAAADSFLTVSRETDASNSSLMMQVRDLADALSVAVSEGDWETASGAMRSLIGCGPGLTPWGDDFVVGVIAGYECLSGDADHRTLMRLRGLCSERVATTSDISRSILLDAIAGHYGMPVYDLCEAIIDAGSDLSVTGQIRSHMHIGASSGEANCYGILSGMAAACGDDALLSRLRR